MPLGTSFPLVRYRLSGVVEQPLAFADFAGSALRGAFGHALKAAACTTGLDDCKRCTRYRDCAYPLIFEPPPPAAGARSYSQLPAPYVIEPPAPGPLALAAGQPFQFGLVLIGPALEHLPLIASAWRQALAAGIGRQGRVRLIDVRDETGAIVFDASDASDAHIREHALSLPIAPTPATLDTVLLDFSTPLSFFRGGRSVPPAQLTAHDLLMALVRRVAAFALLHLDTRLPIDFTTLAQRARAIRGVTHWQAQHWQRYSSRQRRAMPVAGVTGQWRLHGDLAPFWPYLYLGQWLHVGKKCSFGLGRYHLHAPAP